jgi:hypothetical protein
LSYASATASKGGANAAQAARFFCGARGVRQYRDLTGDGARAELTSQRAGGGWSGKSIDDEEFQLQRRGCAAAVTTPVRAAIQAGAHGAVVLCFLEWAGPDQRAVVAKWMRIHDGEGAAEFAKILLDAPRSFAGLTAIDASIDFAVAQLEAGGIAAKRRIIDVSGDGSDNSGQPVTVARDKAVAKGITINGLAIINEKPGREPRTVFYEHTHPPGGLPNYYRENVIGGPGAFVLQIVNFDTFAEAMTNKLLTEVSQHKIQAP